MKLDDENTAISVSHTRLVLEQYDEKRSSLYENKLLHLLFNQRHWSTELMIESLWWSLGNSTNDTNNLKKSHSPGSPFFLGVSLIKLCSYGNATKLGVSIHTLRTEYSMSLANFVVKSVHCIKQYGVLGKSFKASNKKQLNNKETVSSNLLMEFNIKDITAYFINHHKACLLLSFSDINVKRNQYSSKIKLEDIQLAIMRSMTSSVLCLTDFNDIFAKCKLVRLEVENAEKKPLKVSVYIPGNSEAIWNSNLHMHILTLVHDIKDLKAIVASYMPKAVLTADTEQPKPTKKQFLLELSAERGTVFEIKLSERHSMQWYFENLFFSHKEGNFISAENIFIKIDDQHIFTLKDVDVHSLQKLDMLTEARVNCEGFVLPTNKVWVTTIGSFKVLYKNLLFFM